MVLTREEALLDAIYAAPDDDAPRQVYADALTERGDPRGEFITLQLARARGPVSAEQLRRERELSNVAEHRVAWARPFSQSGDCHFSRGFPDTIKLERGRLEELLDHPAVNLLHAVTGLNDATPTKVAEQFLFQGSAARLTSVGALKFELFERLDGPLRWPSVGLRFAPLAAHQPLLSQVKELVLPLKWPKPKADSFGGLQHLEKLTMGDARPGAFAPLIGLTELCVSDWYREMHWGELVTLPKLERLEMNVAPNPDQLEGLRLKSLKCWGEKGFDVDAVLAALPSLKELQVVNMTADVARSCLVTMFSSKRFEKLRSVVLGLFHFTQPGSPERTLELRPWAGVNLTAHAPLLELLPADFVSKIVVRPFFSDPWALAGELPSDWEAIRAAAKVPVELAWY
jgi:uncharacterized protein (TIGR02996 family)